MWKGILMCKIESEDKKQSQLLRYYLGSDETLAKKRRQHVMDVQKFKDLDVSKDGQYVAVAAGSSVYFWDVNSNDGPDYQIYKYVFIDWERMQCILN